MRTALFRSAVLAAVNQSFSASAVELAPAQLSLDSELAQVGADVEAGWTFDDDGNKQPSRISDVLQILERGVKNEDALKAMEPRIIRYIDR